MPPEPADQNAPLPGQIGAFLSTLFERVKNTRYTARCHTDPGAECPRVRSTPNNKESSRGHLFTILDVNLKGSDKGGQIVPAHPATRPTCHEAGVSAVCPCR